MRRGGCTGRSCSTCRCRQGGCTLGFCSPWSDHRRASLQPAIMKMQYVFFTHLGNLICALVNLTHSAPHSVENSAWKSVSHQIWFLWQSWFSFSYTWALTCSFSLRYRKCNIGRLRLGRATTDLKTAEDCANAVLYLQKEGLPLQER